MITGCGNFYLLAIPAEQDWTDPDIAYGKACGTLKGDGDTTLQLDASIYTRVDSSKDKETLDRFASAIEDEMRKIAWEDKQAQFDELVDKIAAEHRERSKKKEKPAWFHDLINGKICIVFNAPYEYEIFRLNYSDVLLLPYCRDIYPSHPEIEANKWPVVIHSATYWIKGIPVSPESTIWAIAQSDYRNNRLISGREWFEYDELEDYECASYANERHVWSVARMRRGKDK